MQEKPGIESENECQQLEESVDSESEHDESIIGYPDVDVDEIEDHEPQTVLLDSDAESVIEDGDYLGFVNEVENNESRRITRALILSLSLCYHARLEEQRDEYEEEVVEKFTGLIRLPGGAKQFSDEIRW